MQRQQKKMRQQNLFSRALSLTCYSMIIIVLIGVNSLGAVAGRATASNTDTDNDYFLMINTEAPWHRTDPKFLSFSIDTATWLGLKFWEPNTEKHSPKINLDDPLFNQLTRALAPAYLRVGGTDADKIVYSINDPTDKSLNSKYTFNSNDWDDLIGFVNRNNFSLFFTIGAGPALREKASTFHPGAWNSQSFSDLLRHLNQSSLRPLRPITWEFGNEPNAYWLIHGLNQQLTATQYFQDYQQARALLHDQRTDERLAGPASAVWPILGETIPRLTEILPDFLELASIHSQAIDLMTWHFYPTQSKTCGFQVRAANLKNFTDLNTFNEFRHWALKIQKLKAKYQSEAELWLGESGPAQCGGQLGISDRYISTLWWLDELGSAALYRHNVVIRQSLVGSHYGLLRQNDFTPTSSYWASLLWKQLMGPIVIHAMAKPVGRIEESGFSSLEEHQKDGPLRVYAHCTPATSPYYQKGALTLLLINLSPTETASIDLPPELLGKTSPTQPWLKWSLSSQHLLDEKLYLNNKELRLIEGDPQLVLEPQSIAATSVLADQLHLKIKAASATFVVIPQASVKACL